MRYRGWSVGRATRLVVLKDVPSLDGDGGVIALDRRGRLATPHSSTGLIDAYLTAGGRTVIRFEGR
jgi:L-asparaginase / beta-aspartyl-peptidase